MQLYSKWYIKYCSSHNLFARLLALHIKHFNKYTQLLVHLVKGRSCVWWQWWRRACQWRHVWDGYGRIVDRSRQLISWHTRDVSSRNHPMELKHHSKNFASSSYLSHSHQRLQCSDLAFVSMIIDSYLVLVACVTYCECVHETFNTVTRHYHIIISSPPELFLFHASYIHVFPTTCLS